MSHSRHSDPPASTESAERGRNANVVVSPFSNAHRATQRWRRGQPWGHVIGSPSGLWVAFNLIGRHLVDIQIFHSWREAYDHADRRAREMARP